ncbi:MULTISPECIES: methylation-associated defense system protein MAD7 [unclassified Frankia]|uniref:methylation-associated defense system protein MAD7 n=1 Tax=unclassified Frankia TaxID=2632575 RepID=UPI0020244C6F
MTLVPPKDLRSYSFERLTGVELNDFDVDRFLPVLFEMVVTNGRRLSRSDARPTEPGGYIEALAGHPALRGFGDEHGQAVLEQWVNTSVVRLGHSGRGHRDVQLAAVQPSHIGAYRAGLPAEGARHRKVHLVVYRLLTDALARRGSPNPAGELRSLFLEAFGRGVSISDSAVPRFDGATADLDANVLLSLYYLEGFTPGRLLSARQALDWDPVMPGVMIALGDQLLDFLAVYRHRLPTIALARHLAALVNIGLFTTTLRLFTLVNDLCRGRARPADLGVDRRPARTEIYVDFTRQTGGDSDRLAGECVDRDLERLPAYLDDMLLLKTLDRYAGNEAKLRPYVQDRRGPDWLTALMDLRHDQYVEWRAGLELERIIEETRNVTRCSDEDARAELERAAPGGSQLDQVVAAIRQSQTKQAIKAAGQWFWNTGGMRKQAGLLRGNLRGRRAWRYAMTDELLTTLLLSTLVDPDRGEALPRMRLADLLVTLESRWGLLVDRPPAARADASSRAVANANLVAFTGRLRQMGFFADLSDDFNAQYVINPLAGAGARR